MFLDKKLRKLTAFVAVVCFAVNSFAVTCSIPGNAGPGVVAAYPNGLYPGMLGSTVTAGSTSIAVGGLATGPAVATGSLLMIIQMQGATINSTNSNQYGNGTGSGTIVPASPNPVVVPAAGDLTAAFGSATYAGGSLSYTAGTYEYVVAAGPAAGGVIPLTSPLVNSYSNLAATPTSGQTRYQVIVVPQYSSATVSGTHTIPAWDGSTGGVEVIDVAGALSMTATIDGNGRGFRGGAGVNQTPLCTDNFLFPCQDYRSTNANGWGAFKGEGIAGTPAFVYSSVTAANSGNALGADGYPNGDRSRGAPGNAGGGGNQHNAGGGGGGNGGAGGKGGRSWNSNDPVLNGQEVGGYGGASGYGLSTRLIMGGGGGAGDQNNSTDPAAAGGSGGALVIIRAGSVSGASTINVNGGNGVASTGTDAAGAGGAGGTVMITATTGGTIGGVTINARGGAGAGGNMFGGTETDGPGGGGGGGAVFTNLPLSTAPSLTGGAAGTIIDTINTSCPSTNPALATCGAEAGVNGIASNISSPIASTGAYPGSECLPNITATKTTTTPVLDLLGTATGVASYQIELVNTGGGARAVNIIDNALPPGWVLVGAPAYTYTPAPPTVGNNLASGADNSIVPAVNPVAGAPTTAPTAGANSLAWSNFFIAPLKNDVPSRIRINFNATVPATAPVGCYQNGAGFTFLDPTRTTAAGTQVTAATNNGATRTGVNYSATTTYTAGNAVTAVAGANYNGLVAGSTAEDVCIRPDLQLTKANNNAAPAVGASFAYTITARNNGHVIRDATFAADQTVTSTGAAAGPVLNNVVTDTLPTGIVLTAAPTGTNWTCSGAAGSTAFACTYTGSYPLAAATDLVSAITVPVKALNTACPAAKINTAVLGAAQFAGNGVAGTAGEFNTANNTATDGVGITPNCNASIVVEKTDAKAAAATGTLNSYTINVTNQGPAAADGAIISDTPVSGLTCPGALGSATVACTASTGAQCPGAAAINTPSTITYAAFNAGVVALQLPALGVLSFTYQCTVN